ncbi:MFS family permease [Kitasatospora sp. MAP12-15]|uniref:MFS transporter n=1 Tax=unclassified Kitasatospora TaxID=2633591 RepID=UPI002476FA5C|nr:MFS transporter [Kitasatospora sp. MAP12-44]MDH6111729.1 MFS family permease [Kitasatospora sp. MAP12-44]
MSFLTLLRSPFIARLLLGSWVGRLPSAMAALTIPLALRHAGAGYAFVGVTAGCYAIAAAVGSPLLGRLVDRWGQTRILVPTALLAAAGFVIIALAPRHHALVVVGAVLAGSMTPPLEPCLRVLWPAIAPEDRLESAYALDSSAQELVFVAGPLVVTLSVAIGSPTLALYVQALLGLFGVAVVATAAPSRNWRAQARSRDWLGPLRSRSLVTLLGSLVGVGFAIGTLNVLVISYAERWHVPGGAPTLLALNALGSLCGVLVYGSRSWPGTLATRGLLFACGLVVGYGLLVLVPSPAFMAVIMLLTGMFLAPLLTVTFVLVGELAPPGTTAEAFAWLVTLFACGSSLGAAAVGNVLAHTNEHWAASCGTAGVLVTLAILALGHRGLTARTPVAAAARDTADSGTH